MRCNTWPKLKIWKSTFFFFKSFTSFLPKVRKFSSNSQVHSLDSSLPYGFHLWGRHCSEEHSLFWGDRQVLPSVNSNAKFLLCCFRWYLISLIPHYCLFRFSILLPNKWNVSFYFPNVIRFYLLFGFFPMLYTQMWHMYQLRFSTLYIFPTFLFLIPSFFWLPNFHS